MPSAAALAAANEQLREAVQRRNSAASDLAAGLIKHLLADKTFANATIRAAEDLLPCTLSTQLKTIARGDQWTHTCARLARDRRLLNLVTESRGVSEMALRDSRIANHVVQYSAARKAANEAGMQLRRLTKAARQRPDLREPDAASVSPPHDT